ncbi:MarR family winged helix-turn-helix transcriptional regulator [Oceanobacillus polygoni]|uniref:DNA-binding MarR family transcriptional regulator n=1 Tax=Oceanobacillus polygoni TaxID=1235259 RepID=A0A9X1CLC3_9BACI|nr:MarR family transcriptional regulator [Oceanobacillus polygoni]MBP2079797.1 DNA-binding MarR family transcriptional regulator [Oceanobacillus polygoni]
MSYTEALEIREILQHLVRDFGLLQREGSECCGITVLQSHIIYELDKNPRISLIDLAEKLSMDTGMLSRQINKVVELGYVSRIPDPNDRRYVVLSLTEEGQVKAKEISGEMNKYIGQILEFIPNDKKNQVIDSLQILLSAMKVNGGSGCCTTIK